MKVKIIKNQNQFIGSIKADDGAESFISVEAPSEASVARLLASAITPLVSSMLEEEEDEDEEPVEE